MAEAKAWDWSIVQNPIWRTATCEESHFLGHRWKAAGFHRILDFGCGLGRHAIFFAQQGFEVSAFDLSPDGVEYLRKWAEHEKLDIDAQIADMQIALSRPFL